MSITRRLPWYASCVLVPIVLGWTPEQILTLAPVFILVVILVPVRAEA
ncbi:hypothetical protein EV385_6624 [Krasilnikovia cinnamomea]|uniref:Uncharacterized protein n=1 Tax=Krasilnikovia cinnamomea TaxID=349313 RepID=A0A4Q7Z7V9_9ACTN|nr:hypothetical protein [Krasilnikovia cinnamomea]RZU46550.1 hypothetical protein EV385_6624 [Krasilnikovia cinnamomea]